jgi:cytochrome c-type biogenesis protein CcmF
MVVEFGHFALILALCIALVQSALPLAGALRGVRTWMDSAPVLALAQLLSVGIAFACLARAFLLDDFSVRLVSEHSNTLLPPWFKLSALWGNH